MNIVTRLLLALFTALALNANLLAAKAVELRVVSWNMESGDSDAEFLAEQMAEKQDVVIWGLSEVEPSAFETFGQGAEGDGGNFEVIEGSTGGNDRLVIIYDADRLELLGEDELTDVQLGSPNLRAPLVARFRGRTTEIEFLFMVNHLLRGDGDEEDEERRIIQAQMLNDWADEQELPAIVVSDFNADFDPEFGDAGDRAPLFDELIEDGHLQWGRPVSLVRTQISFNSVLDFVFVANAQELPGWTGISQILEMEGDEVATSATFSDDGDETDHRPVDAIFTMVDVQPESGRIVADQPLRGSRGRVAPSAGLEALRRDRPRRDEDVTLQEIMRRLDRIEQELARLGSEIRPARHRRAQPQPEDT